MSYDFLAIGDIVTDAFIRLKEASVHCNIKKETCEICMKFKEKIPYEAAHIVPAVGNSANAAASVSRLGLSSALVSNLGDDRYGTECMEVLVKEGVATEFMRMHPGASTNYHYVLWYDDDRTILVKHEAYDYVLPELGEPRWVYLSSLGENTLAYHKDISEYLRKNSRSKLAFQPGTFQMKFGHEALAEIYERTEVFFCNKEEAQRILRTDEHAVGKLLRAIQKLGPRITVITDGKAGAYASEGREAWFMPSYPDPKPPYERTGAGDAFASTVVAALALDMPLREALRWGPVNSMSVVQYVGAREGLLTRARLESYLEKAPASYEPQKL